MFARPRPKKSLLPPPAKRRKIISGVEEINFDFDARADYLTGFHKRKLQRSKQAQEEAAKKAKEERIAARKQLREDRRKELEAHVDAVNTLLREARVAGVDEEEDLEGEAWDGIQDDQRVESIDYEAEYVDEDRYTTVTVEAIDVSKDGLHKIVVEDGTGQDEDNREEELREKAINNMKTAANKVWPKKTKKRFRYESKVERKASRAKQKVGNRLKADARRERV